MTKIKNSAKKSTASTKSSTASKPKRSKKVAAAYTPEQEAGLSAAELSGEVSVAPQGEQVSSDKVAEAIMDHMTVDPIAELKAAPSDHQHMEKAITLLGETAIIWTKVCEGGKKLFRVGVPAVEGDKRFVEDGKKIVGAGASYAQALKQAEKSLSVKFTVPDAEAAGESEAAL